MCNEGYRRSHLYKSHWATCHLADFRLEDNCEICVSIISTWIASYWFSVVNRIVAISHANSPRFVVSSPEKLEARMDHEGLVFSIRISDSYDGVDPYCFRSGTLINRNSDWEITMGRNRLSMVATPTHDFENRVIEDD